MRSFMLLAASAPINNFNIWQDYGRSEDDQRYRFMVERNMQTARGGAVNAWQHVTHGFEWSNILQYYSALPFNITTGANTVQGTTARPTINGVFINRRTFVLHERLRLPAMAEAFDAFNHGNNLIPNETFGAGAYPSATSSTFGQPTAGGDSRTMPLALRFTF